MLVKRITLVKCDSCSLEARIEHQISGSSDGAFNNALAESGWINPYVKNKGYLHICPKCKQKQASITFLRDTFEKILVDDYVERIEWVDNPPGHADGDYARVILRNLTAIALDRLIELNNALEAKIMISYHVDKSSNKVNLVVEVAANN